MKSNCCVSLLITATLAFFGCKDEGVGPKEEIQPGKRNYTWSIDSVDYGNLPSTIQLECIWGSSSTNIWGAAGDAPDVRDCLWHYDGIKWSRATAGTPITEYTGNKTVYAVWGSARNDVWAVGRKINLGVLSAFLMHYDGTRWTDVTPSNVAALRSVLYEIYGVGGGIIWVGGDEYALDYDGSDWRTHKVADSVIVNSITSNAKKVYLVTYSPWGKESIVLFSSSDGFFQPADSSTRSQIKFGTLLWATDTRLISFANGVISAPIDGRGVVDTSGWHRDVTAPTGLMQRFVQRQTNVFAVGYGGLIYHYDGIDWKQITISVPSHAVDPKAWLWGVWADSNEVFICDWENGIVYHGK